ncbi:RNB domain-containing ribonuclease, partial [Escherichia coli]
VSHYVRPDKPLDEEAKERGTSVYFPHFVLPMLPEALSNGLCSLNPHLDRLCMVCDLNLSRAGKVTSFQFYPSVMHSKA